MLIPPFAWASIVDFAEGPATYARRSQHSSAQRMLDHFDANSTYRIPRWSRSGDGKRSRLLSRANHHRSTLKHQHHPDKHQAGGRLTAPSMTLVTFRSGLLLASD